MNELCLICKHIVTPYGGMIKIEGKSMHMECAMMEFESEVRKREE